MSQDSPVGFALFGIGRAGNIHGNNLIRDPQARLKYIVDIDEDKAKEFVKSNYLDTKVVPPSAMETVLGDKTVTAAVITTPTHLHEDLILSCLKAGKAVFCEKPIAATAEGIGKNFITRFKLRSSRRNISLKTTVLNVVGKNKTKRKKKKKTPEYVGKISAQPHTLIMYTFCDSNSIHARRFTTFGRGLV